MNTIDDLLDSPVTKIVTLLDSNSIPGYERMSERREVVGRDCGQGSDWREIKDTLAVCTT